MVNVFLVYAHPNPNSLNGQLKKYAIEELLNHGHEIKVSDLYAMNWKAIADANDFPGRDPQIPLDYGIASGEAYRTGTQTADITEEQKKLEWADVVVLQFPLWWYGMPAILKGWIDRVYALGFAYGVGEHGKDKWGERFGEGRLQGKRAMICTTIGGRTAQYGPRGINGPIDDILWPIHHGVLFYPGMSVMPPTIFYEVRHADASAVGGFCRLYANRILSIMEDCPIPFRTQNGGDYDGHQTLRPGLEGSATGLLIHQQHPVYTSNTQLSRGQDFSVLHVARDSRSCDR
jgi:NAD(P)H dehydrogenase (quinone)